MQHDITMIIYYIYSAVALILWASWRTQGGSFSMLSPERLWISWPLCLHQGTHTHTHVPTCKQLSVELGHSDSYVACTYGEDTCQGWTAIAFNFPLSHVQRQSCRPIWAQRIKNNMHCLHSKGHKCLHSKGHKCHLLCGQLACQTMST